MLEAIQHLIDPRLVIDRVLRRAEALELRDVRAGDERFAARAAQNQDADIRIVVDALAGVQQRSIHLPRHRVARVGPVEGQDRQRTLCVERRVRSGQRVASSIWLFGHLVIWSFGAFNNPIPIIK